MKIWEALEAEHQFTQNSIAEISLHLIKVEGYKPFHLNPDVLNSADPVSIFNFEKGYLKGLEMALRLLKEEAL